MPIFTYDSFVAVQAAFTNMLADNLGTILLVAGFYYGIKIVFNLLSNIAQGSDYWGGNIRSTISNYRYRNKDY